MSEQITDVVTKLYENLDKFDPSRNTNSFSYFNTIAVNLVLLSLKHKHSIDKNTTHNFDNDEFGLTDAKASAYHDATDVQLDSDFADDISAFYEHVVEGVGDLFFVSENSQRPCKITGTRRAITTAYATFVMNTNMSDIYEAMGSPPFLHIEGRYAKSYLYNALIEAKIMPRGHAIWVRYAFPHIYHEWRRRRDLAKQEHAL